MCIMGGHTEDREMTDYSNMSRGEAVERCIGLERVLEMMAEAVKQIAELERDADRLVEALQLAANRLDSIGLWQPAGSIEYRLGRDWSEEAMLSIAAYRKEVKS